jgi:hypothetical protein
MRSRISNAWAALVRGMMQWIPCDELRFILGLTSRIWQV